ncbi:Lrp/AsnC family transcriptional regulator [Streptomyces sp. NPDC039016]|uniref:Lrp/AsnC family transcriptional regulator n=1 Tax=Streptomyces sp. NPDC039016 TaxID=3154330 RepID=UPI0033F9CD48
MDSDITAGAAEVLDELDHAVIRLLAREPRAAFADVGARLGVHERTVARRLDRLIAAGLVRFTAFLVPEHLGEGLVVELAVRCAPGRLHETALALARRPDVRAVDVATGASEVVAEMIVPGTDQLLSLVDGPVARIPGVTGIHTAVVLRLLLTATDWDPYGDEPTRTRRLVAEGGPLPAPPAVDDLDRRLVALLERDARAPMTRLAQELCVGETTARRRLARLMDSHILHLRLHAEPEVLGFPVEARFRLTVEHRFLDAAVRRLAGEPEVRHLVLTTGHSNVQGYSSHRTTQDLRAFTARVFAQLDGVTAAEAALLLRTYKRAGVVTERGHAERGHAERASPEAAAPGGS